MNIPEELQKFLDKHEITVEEYLNYYYGPELQLELVEELPNDEEAVIRGMILDK